MHERDRHVVSWQLFPPASLVMVCSIEPDETRRRYYGQYNGMKWFYMEPNRFGVTEQIDIDEGVVFDWLNDQLRVMMREYRVHKTLAWEVDRSIPSAVELENWA